MSIELQMELIAAQLTRIGDLLEGHPGVAVPASSRPATKSKSEPKRIASQKETPKTDLKEPLDVPEPVTGVEYTPLSKYFFGMLTQIKTHKGLPVAKKVCAKTLEKFTGGKPLDKESLPLASYDKFYQEVQRVRAQHGITD